MCESNDYATYYRAMENIWHIPYKFLQRKDHKTAIIKEKNCSKTS